MRSPHTATKSSPRSPQLEKAHAQQRRPNAAINKLKKKDEVYIQWNITQPKKNKIMPFAATWMDLEIIILSEVSQKGKDKYHMTALSLTLNFSVFSFNF